MGKSKNQILINHKGNKSLNILKQLQSPLLGKTGFENHKYNHKKRFIYKSICTLSLKIAMGGKLLLSGNIITFFLNHVNHGTDYGWHLRKPIQLSHFMYEINCRLPIHCSPIQ